VSVMTVSVSDLEITDTQTYTDTVFIRRYLCGKKWKK